MQQQKEGIISIMLTSNCGQLELSLEGYVATIAVKDVKYESLRRHNT